MVAALTDGAITDRPSLRPTVTLEEGGRHDIDGGHAMHEANRDRTHRSRTSASVGRSVCVPTLTGVDRCPHPIGPIRADMSSYVRAPSTAAEMHNHAWASGPANVRNCRDQCVRVGVA